MEHFRKLERMYERSPCNQSLDLDIAIDAGAAEVVLGVDESMYHPGSAAHGQYYFKVLDDATFFAANSLVDDVFVLTTSFNLYLERPVSAGHMRAEGRVVNDNPRQLIAEGVAYDAEGNEIARGSGTFTHSGIELTADVGYE
jgi:uncharacterized protein (TIGR00369 family)